MKKILMTLSFIISMTDVFANNFEPKSISCSKAGTVIFYINGINTDQAGFKSSVDQLSNSLGSRFSNLDSKGIVEITGEHNSTEGLMLDILQLINQKLAGQKKTKDMDISKLIAMYFNSPTLFMVNAGIQIYKEIQEEIAISVSQTEISQKDVKKMAEKIKTFLEADKKVIVVSHSQGNIYANYVYNELLSQEVSAEKLNRYYGNVQVGSVASSVSAKNHRVFSLVDDFALFALNLRTPNILKREYSISSLLEPEALCSFDLCHGFTETYQSASIDVVGPQQGKGRTKRKAVDVLRDHIEEVAWMLANNDENCCRGEDGRFYRKDYNSPVSEFFIGKNVKIDSKATLNLTSDSAICGSTKVSGKLSMNNSEIYGSPSIEAGSQDGLIMISSSIDGSPTIKDDLIMRNAIIEGSGFYSGKHRPNYVYSEIAYGTFRGGNNFSGYYNVRGNVENSTVEGSSLIMSNYGNPHFTLTLEGLPNTNFRSGITIRGVGYLNATIGPRSNIHGTPLLRNTNCPTCGDWVGGVITHGINTEISSNTDSPTNPITQVRGGLFLGNNVKIRNGSYVAGIGMRLDKGVPAIHLNSIVDASNITGGFYITSAQVLNSNVSGIPYVCTSVLDGASVTGNAVTCSGTYTGSYGSNWICNAYDEEGNTSFPTQCAIDDGTFKNESGNYTALSEEDLVQNASLLQKKSQEYTYQDALATMEEMGI